ncbi:MAG TPA: hypothetical protein VII94_05320 [Candidatus Saccharimonadales bacterium]
MSIDVAELFETELGVFHERLEEWLVRDVGRFVLIKDAEVRGPYDTQNDTITVGYETFGNVPFLTKQIMPFEHPMTFTRL